MPSLEISSGARIHYQDENTLGADIILLLHGLGANSTSWQLQTPFLKKIGFRVIVPDVPGFGKSTYAGGYSSVPAMAGQIAEFIHALGVNTYTLVGLSMGGTLALQLALDFPHEVNKLVLVNTFSKLQVLNMRVLPYALLRLILVHTLGLPTQARAVSKRVFPHPQQGFLRQELINQITEADVHAYRAVMRALSRYNVNHRLCEIKTPTLVITGDSDTTVPIPNQICLAQSISSARHVFIPQAGHAVTVEQPDLFNQTLSEFLQS